MRVPKQIITIIRKFGKYAEGFLILSIFLVGIGAFYKGVSDYRSINSYDSSLPSNVLIYGDYEQTLDDVTVILQKQSPPYSLQGWMSTTIDIKSTDNPLELYIRVPNEIKMVTFINYSHCTERYTDWSYNETTTNSILYFSYTSNVSHHIRILFEWKISQKISFDQERIAILLYSPYLNQPVFNYPLNPRQNVWIPKIEKITILIEGFHLVDFSSTHPPPSTHYISGEGTSVSWIFGIDDQKSSVQVIFIDQVLSGKKSGVLYLSGIYTGLGISISILGVELVLTRLLPRASATLLPKKEINLNDKQDGKSSPDTEKESTSNSLRNKLEDTSESKPS